MSTTKVAAKSIDVIWVVVSNLDEAVAYYTETLGFTLQEFHKEYKWAEVQGANGGTRLGLAEENAEMQIKAGTNAVVTYSVESIEEAKETLIEKGVTMIGDIQEVPGHVRMQTFVDKDGNMFQLVEKLEG